MPIDATQPYDDQNIFARILRDEIPSRRVYEDEWAIAFHDVAPQAATHLLVIPRGPYVSWDDFAATASAEEIAGFVRAVGIVAAGPPQGAPPPTPKPQKKPPPPPPRAPHTPATAYSPIPARTPARRCRTSTSTCSAASRSGRCSPDKDCAAPPTR